MSANRAGYPRPALPHAIRILYRGDVGRWAADARLLADLGPRAEGGDAGARLALFRLGMLAGSEAGAVPAMGEPEATAGAADLARGLDRDFWWPRANLRGLLLAGVPLETLRSAMAGARAAGRNPWREVRRLWPAEEPPPSGGR